MLDPRETIRRGRRRRPRRRRRSASSRAGSTPRSPAAPWRRACEPPRRSGTDLVVLSGGVFQNRRLLEAAGAGLDAAGLRVLTPQRLPANDGGIAYGQAAVAARRCGVRDVRARAAAGARARSSSRPCSFGAANVPFGELTADDARARADELRAAIGWGPTARVAPVALAWRELAVDDGARRGSRRARPRSRSSSSSWRRGCGSCRPGEACSDAAWRRLARTRSASRATVT